MQEFSYVFLFFEYIKYYANAIAGFINQPAVRYCGLGLGCVLVMAGVYIQHNARKNGLRRHTLRNVGVCLLFVILMSMLVDNWDTYVGGYSMIMFFVFSVFWAAFTLISVLLFLAQKSVPSHKATMSSRQLIGVSSIIGIVVCLMLAVYYVDINGITLAVRIILGAIEIIALIFWMWEPFIFMLSRFVGRRKKPPLESTGGKLNRIAVLCCADNEEKVVDYFVRSLYATTYPKNKFDIYIVADNSTDNTAEVAAKNGAVVFELFDEPNRAHGIEWIIRMLQNRARQGDSYDAYVILEVDTVVNDQFFDEINEHLNMGYEVMQCHVGCKNPSSNWISRSHAYNSTMYNACYQEAHERLRLSAGTHDSGLVFRPSVLEIAEWPADSTSPGCSLGLEYTAKTGRPCHYVQGARIYAEQPTKMYDSMAGRTRRIQARAAAMHKYGLKSLLSGIGRMSMIKLDSAVSMFMPLANIIVFSTYILRALATIFFSSDVAAQAFILDFKSSTALLMGYFVIQMFVLYREGLVRYVVHLPAQVIFGFSWIMSGLRGIMKSREHFWIPLSHSHSMSASEVRENVKLIERQQFTEGVYNIHRLPLGHILLKAGVITRPQLDKALHMQKTKGGYLGDIIVEMQAVSPELLENYLSIQSAVKRAATDVGVPRVMIGNILIESGVITEHQLKIAVDYQKNYGGFLGECLVKTNCMDAEMLEIFLEIQKLLDNNYVSLKSAHHFISGVISESDSQLGNIMVEGGIISTQQLSVALRFQQQHGGQLGSILVDYGFISEDTMQSLLELQAKSRRYASENAGFQFGGGGLI